MQFLNEEYRAKLLNRFLRYVKVWTTSDSSKADLNIQPSTQRQFDLAKILESELKAFGLSKVQITKNCYVYGKLNATAGFEKIPSFCLLAHMDTVEECSGENVNPILEKIKIDDKPGNYENPVQNTKSSFIEENDNLSDIIIKTDGTTLLGADDKAGIAEIMTFLEYLAQNKNFHHGQIEVCFSPDEETGHGMDNVPLDLIESKQAYTVDGGNMGELETECFNAYKSEIIFTGKSIHTGSARGKLVNAVTMASTFLTLLPKNEAPETTDGKEGFFAPMEVFGTIENSKIVLFLRDFTTEGIERRKSLVEKIAKTVEEVSGGKSEVIHTFQYSNMKEGMKTSPSTVENLIEAYKEAGIEPVFPAIRGGTDGSRLTEMGIPCPNIFTGGHNFHSKSEWASLKEMSFAVEVLLNLSKVM